MVSQTFYSMHGASSLLVRPEAGGHVDDIDALVRGVQDGNRGAFSQLYEAFFDRVYRYMLARVSSPTEAEDLTQEVFLKAMRAIGGYQFRGSPFAAWLFRIAHNVLVDRHRQNRGLNNSVALEDAEPVSSGEDVAQEAIRDVSFEQVQAALTELTDLQREVVLCRFVAELSLAETAKAMNRDVNTVKALQHAALKSLRRLLEQREKGVRQVEE